jgi:hypothetical protein
MMMRVARRELRIGAVAIERAGKLFRQLAAQRQIRRISLEGHRRIISGEERLFRKRNAHDAFPFVCRALPRKSQTNRGKGAKACAIHYATLPGLNDFRNPAACLVTAPLHFIIYCILSSGIGASLRHWAVAWRP